MAKLCPLIILTALLSTTASYLSGLQSRLLQCPNKTRIQRKGQEGSDDGHGTCVKFNGRAVKPGVSSRALEGGYKNPEIGDQAVSLYEYLSPQPDKLCALLLASRTAFVWEHGVSRRLSSYDRHHNISNNNNNTDPVSLFILDSMFSFPFPTIRLQLIFRFNHNRNPEETMVFRHSSVSTPPLPGENPLGNSIITSHAEARH
ncbi:hypothetical protein LZ30DRAFT_775403 [Colletotrichum cereale]|nr:hypothetical protein LZ30DRAFT_775403 [Colletotrichum cereale]